MYDENKCVGIGGKLFGHKFEAVFEYETKNEPDPAVLQAIMPTVESCYNKLIDAGYDGVGNAVEEVLETLKTEKRTYVHHVCIRCGKIVKKD